MVRPELEHDSKHRQGQIGLVTEARLETDDIVLGFEDHHVGLYSSDALLTLKTPEEIYEYLRQNSISISVNDFKDLKQIALLTDHGTRNQVLTAFELIQKNNNILDAATVGLDQLLGINQQRGPKR